MLYFALASAITNRRGRHVDVVAGRKDRMTMIKTTFGVYLLLEKRHNVETSSRIFGRGSTIGENECDLLYSLGSAVSFIMVHLIKPTRLMAAFRVNRVHHGHGMLPKAVASIAELRKELIGRYQKFSLTYIRGRFRGTRPIVRVHVVVAASANEHSDIIPLPAQMICIKNYAMHARG